MHQTNRTRRTVNINNEFQPTIQREKKYLTHLQDFIKYIIGPFYNFWHQQCWISKYKVFSSCITLPYVYVNTGMDERHVNDI